MTMMEQTTLSERLRRARRGARLGSAELAARIGVAPETLSRYENGRSDPSRLVLYAYAAETGVPLEWLETGAITNAVTDPVTSEYRALWADQLPVLVGAA